LSIDWNHDGVIDFLGIYGPGIDSIAHHDYLISHEESSVCDGIFDIEVDYDTSGKINQVSLDLDRDNLADEVAQGNEARSLLDEARKGSCFGNIDTSQATQERVNDGRWVPMKDEEIRSPQ
jgi:hypothetical protein